MTAFSLQALLIVEWETVWFSSSRPSTVYVASRSEYLWSGVQYKHMSQCHMYLSAPLVEVEPFLHLCCLRCTTHSLLHRFRTPFGFRSYLVGAIPLGMICVVIVKGVITISIVFSSIWLLPLSCWLLSYGMLCQHYKEPQSNLVTNNSSICMWSWHREDILNTAKNLKRPCLQPIISYVHSRCW